MPRLIQGQQAKKLAILLALFFTILVLIVLNTDILSAETSVSGTISSNTTWGTANSPYIVTGNVTVASGVTLTIEQGTSVKFNSGTELVINGALVARGTATSTITFTSSAASPAAGDWSYIQFTDSSTDATFDGNGDYSSGSILEHCIIEYGGGSSVGGSVEADQALPFINYCTIRHSASKGISYLNGSLKVHNSTISQNSGNGIAISENVNSPTTPTYSVSLVNNTVTENSYTGISIYKVEGQTGNVTIDNNTVTGNGGNGIYATLYPSGDLTITNSTINSNGEAGIYIGHAAFTVTNNEITSNERGITVVNGSGSPNVISGNTIAYNDSRSADWLSNFGNGYGGLFISYAHSRSWGPSLVLYVKRSRPHWSSLKVR